MARSRPRPPGRRRMSMKTGTLSYGAGTRSRFSGAASVWANLMPRRWCCGRSGDQRKVSLSTAHAIAAAPASAKSLRLRAGKLDHFGPFLGFGFDEIVEISNRQRHRLTAKIDQTALELRIGERRVDLFVQLVDDRRRRRLGRADPEPRGGLVARQKFAERRKIRQCIRTRRAGHGEAAQLAGSYEIKRRRQRVEGDLHLAA